VKYAEITKLMK